MFDKNTLFFAILTIFCDSGLIFPEQKMVYFSYKLINLAIESDVNTVLTSIECFFFSIKLRAQAWIKSDKKTDEMW